MATARPGSSRGKFRAKGESSSRFAHCLDEAGPKVRITRSGQGDKIEDRHEFGCEDLALYGGGAERDLERLEIAALRPMPETLQNLVNGHRAEDERSAGLRQAELQVIPFDCDKACGINPGCGNGRGWRAMRSSLNR